MAEEWPKIRSRRTTTVSPWMDIVVFVLRIAVTMTCVRVAAAQCAAAGIADLGSQPLVGRQEPGVEELIEAPPFVAATAQQRLQAPAQDMRLEQADAFGCIQHLHRIAAADGKAVGAQETGKAR